MLKIVDLFSGIGGFSLGFEMASSDFETVAFCEKDKSCQAVLRKHWPHVPIYDDVKNLKGEQLGEYNILCGGFPCQPYSLAGKRKGATDDRDQWPEMFRIVKESRPDWVVGENTTGFISMGLDNTLSDLENEGYTCRTFAIPAVGVQACHKRERTWIIAHITDKNDRSHHTKSSERQAFESRESLSTRHVPHIDDTGRSEQRRAIAIHAEQFTTERHCRWPTEPNMGRVVHGLSGRVDRIRQLGNAVVPQVVRDIADAIHRVEEAKGVFGW